ncbi:hypothetical protein D3C78_478660 [compost metagenome]
MIGHLEIQWIGVEVADIEFAGTRQRLLMIITIRLGEIDIAAPDLIGLIALTHVQRQMECQRFQQLAIRGGDDLFCQATGAAGTARQVRQTEVATTAEQGNRQAIEVGADHLVLLATLGEHRRIMRVPDQGDMVQQGLSGGRLLDEALLAPVGQFRGLSVTGHLEEGRPRAGEATRNLAVDQQAQAMILALVVDREGQLDEIGILLQHQLEHEGQRLLGASLRPALEVMGHTPLPGQGHHLGLGMSHHPHIGLLETQRDAPVMLWRAMIVVVAGIPIILEAEDLGEGLVEAAVGQVEHAVFHLQLVAGILDRRPAERTGQGAAARAEAVVNLQHLVAKGRQADRDLYLGEVMVFGRIMHALILAPDAAIIPLLRDHAVGDLLTLIPEAELFLLREDTVSGDQLAALRQGVDQDQGRTTGLDVAAQRQLAQQVDMGALGQLVGHLQPLEDAGVRSVGVGADAMGLGTGQQTPDLVDKPLLPGQPELVGHGHQGLHIVGHQALYLVLQLLDVVAHRVDRLVHAGILGIEELAVIHRELVAAHRLQPLEVFLEGRLDEVIFVRLVIVLRQLLLEIRPDRRLIVAHGQQEFIEGRLVGDQFERRHGIGLALGCQLLGQQLAAEEGIVRPAIAIDQHIGDDATLARAFPEEFGRQLVLVAHAAAEGELGDPDAIEDLREIHRMAEAVRQIGDHGRAAQGIRIFDAQPQVVDHGLATHGERLGLGVPWPDEQPLRLDQRLQPAAILRADGEVILDDGRLTIQQEVVHRPLLQHLDRLAHVIDELNLRFTIGEIPFIIPVGLIYNVAKFLHFHITDDKCY